MNSLHGYKQLLFLHKLWVSDETDRLASKNGVGFPKEISSGITVLLVESHGSA